MNGSRLGRGRGGRLAVYGGCGVVVVLLVCLYRAATSEMARLREIHIQCAHQQEALAAQLQVIFEYKVRLEKSLAEEKSSNAAVKQELQQRASREKSLRDKDSIEALQRFNSLQQTCKLLKTEHQDLQEECKKREKQALEDTNRLEATLRELRSRIRQAREDKEKSLEHLKNKFLELGDEKSRLEEKYNDMLKSSGKGDSTMERLRKEVFQLKRELEEAKKSARRATSPGPSIINPQPLQPGETQSKPGGDAGIGAQLADPSQQQQVSPPIDDDKNPQPLNAPIAQQIMEDPLQSNEQRVNEVNNVRFAQKNGNIVPVGPNEIKEAEGLPLPYDLQEKRGKKNDDESAIDTRIKNGEVAEGEDVRDDETQKTTVETSRTVIIRKSTVATSSMKSIPAVKLETSTPASSGNPASTSLDKALPLLKPASKSKLPVGVPPIPVMIDQKLEHHEEKQDEVARKKEEPKQKNNNADSKEQEVENGNLGPPFPAIAARRSDDQLPDRRDNGWFNVGPGVQEIGDELNHMRLPGLEAGADQNAEADDQYDGVDYDKEPQQKNGDLHLVESEDEGEDEDDQADYPHNLKQEKRE